MGLFSGSKKIYVSSVVYNMAGDEAKRPNYLKTTIFGGIYGQVPSLGENLVNSYLTGPDIKLRQFGRWARTSGYSDLLGLTQANSYGKANIDRNVLEANIPHPSDKKVEIQYAEIGIAEYGYWVDQWILQNKPNKATDNYAVDFDDITKTATIVWSDNTVSVFTAAGFDASKRYMYVGYGLVTENQVKNKVVGTTYIANTNSDFPSTTGWVTQSEVNTPGTITLNVTTDVEITYSDGRPEENSTSTVPTSTPYSDLVGSYTKSTFIGEQTPGELLNEVRTLHISKTHKKKTTSNVSSVDETISGGVIKTTTTTVTTESLDYGGTYRTDIETVIQKSWDPIQIMIYQEGSGNPVYDAMFPGAQSLGHFFPFIPMRIDNRFIDENYYGNIYPHAVKALKKSTTGKWKDLITTISDNPSLGDIDYAYVVFGVSLNVKENACRRYVYKFFQEALIASGPTVDAYNQWKADWNAAKDARIAWEAWRQTAGDTGAPEPPLLPFPPVPVYTSLVASSGNAGLNFNIATMWSGLAESVGSGLIKPGAKKGDVVFQAMSTEVFETGLYDSEGNMIGTREVIDHTQFLLQDTATSWRKLDLYGLKNRNMIYGGKSVLISGNEALADTEESGFIIPLHEETYRDFELVPGTQMATANCFLMFNCYQVVKQKWYQSGLFQVVIVIAAVVISVYTGFSDGGGLLGSALSVGTSLGFTGMVAIIVGAAANAIAAMILVKIISEVSTAVFGDKLGALIAVIASVAAIQMGTAYMNNQSLATSFSSLLKADNILKLTVAAGNGYSNYINAATREIQKDTASVIVDYQNQMKEIASLFEKNLGSTGVVLDPTIITEATDSVYESPDSFFTRTLMSGTDVADMSINMLSNFADITLSLDLEG